MIDHKYEELNCQINLVRTYHLGPTGGYKTEPSHPSNLLSSDRQRHQKVTDTL